MMPRKVSFEPHEADRINRVRVAHYLKILPSQVDAMPYEDVADILAVMWGDQRVLEEQSRKRRKR